jgi:hypothetical protein
MTAAYHVHAETGTSRSEMVQAQSILARRLSPDNTIGALLGHPAFAGFARLTLPWDDRSHDSGMNLQSVGSVLPYHSRRIGSSRS